MVPPLLSLQLLHTDQSQWPWLPATSCVASGAFHPLLCFSCSALCAAATHPFRFSRSDQWCSRPWLNGWRCVGGCGVHCRYISKWTVIACAVSPFISTPSPDGNHCSLIGCLLFLLHGGVNCMSGIMEMHARAELLLKADSSPFLAKCLPIYLIVYFRCLMPPSLTLACLKWKDCTCTLIGIHLQASTPPVGRSPVLPWGHCVTLAASSSTGYK